MNMTVWCVRETSVEYRQKLLGTDIRKPRFSWKTLSDRRGVLQSAYQIQVAKEDISFNKRLWDTGKICSEFPFSQGSPFVFYMNSMIIINTNFDNYLYVHLSSDQGRIKDQNP